MSYLFSALLFITSNTLLALSISPEVEQEYLSRGGSKRALEHMNCFLHNYEKSTFSIKPANLADRCNRMEPGSYGKINIENQSYAVIVDYTQPSSLRRFYLLNLDGSDSMPVQTFYVSHGKKGAQSAENTVPGYNKNTIEWVKYFSNKEGSKASSTGFFITGLVYQGMWDGPNDDKNSLIVHGVSRYRNDNACDRAVVVHGKEKVYESGANEGVNIMSAGCFMLDYGVINEVVDLIRGGGGPVHTSEPRVGGTVLLSYGPKEASEPANFYCTDRGSKTLRLK